MVHVSFVELTVAFHSAYGNEVAWNGFYVHEAERMQYGRYLDKRRMSSHASQYALGWEKSACVAQLFKLRENVWIRWCKHISVYLFLGLSNYIVQQILKSESLTDVDSRCTSCGLVQSLMSRFSIELETYTLWNCDVMFKDITQSCMKIIQSCADSITYGVRYQESGRGTRFRVLETLLSCPLYNSSRYLILQLGFKLHVQLCLL
ncbi:unnamed protein product [Albugo candida]|uniref:Uncharacterized protein n=1 Tax=Albugo candida TaxID=65357 RepID=A0A024FX14_9STRA|nr:unnamed protein product [Albugo candida]|eukprot:CCI11447.1 unnamed protein product [Albugo candida]